MSVLLSKFKADGATSPEQIIEKFAFNIWGRPQIGWALSAMCFNIKFIYIYQTDKNIYWTFSKLLEKKT